MGPGLRLQVGAGRGHRPRAQGDVIPPAETGGCRETGPGLRVGQPAVTVACSGRGT